MFQIVELGSFKLTSIRAAAASAAATPAIIHD